MSVRALVRLAHSITSLTANKTKSHNASNVCLSCLIASVCFIASPLLLSPERAPPAPSCCTARGGGKKWRCAWEGRCFANYIEFLRYGSIQACSPPSTQLRARRGQRWTKEYV